MFLHGAFYILSCVEKLVVEDFLYIISVSDLPTPYIYVRCGEIYSVKK